MVTFERPQPELGTEGDVVARRIGAFAIDFIGFYALWGLLTGLIGIAGDSLAVFTGGVGGILFFAYLIYFEAEYGQTIGKMALGVVVVTEDGGPISYRESVIRTLLRIVDALPFLYLIGLVAIYLTDRNQRVGDLVADTIVVRTKSSEKL